MVLLGYISQSYLCIRIQPHYTQWYTHAQLVTGQQPCCYMYDIHQSFWCTVLHLGGITYLYCISWLTIHPTVWVHRERSPHTCTQAYTSSLKYMHRPFNMTTKYCCNTTCTHNISLQETRQCYIIKTMSI